MVLGVSIDSTLRNLDGDLTSRWQDPVGSNPSRLPAFFKKIPTQPGTVDIAKSGRTHLGL